MVERYVESLELMYLYHSSDSNPMEHLYKIRYGNSEFYRKMREKLGNKELVGIAVIPVRDSAFPYIICGVVRESRDDCEENEKILLQV